MRRRSAAALAHIAAALGKVSFAPLAALPGAVFSVWHDLSGSTLAGHGSGRRPAATPSRPPGEVA